MDEDKAVNSKVIGSFIAGFIIGIGIMFLIGDRVPSLNGGGGDDNMTGSGGNSALVSENNNVAISDQLSGDRVLIDTVSIEKDGWVVIHEEVNGVLGNALGAHRLNAGVSEKVYVKLLRNTEINQTYHALLYNDNGDKEFNLGDDSPLQDSLGGFIEGVFMAVQIDRKTQ
ncbi:hypothetical protein IIB51_00700 [Patescibacteria group bacterium]|nr:hypothetical protein [Patescibacteria group bacterium]MCH8889003.1 hypothetical protein [Patescibacteria group bacterium]